LPANPTEPKTYHIDDTIRVPVALRDEEGVAQTRRRTLWARLRSFYAPWTWHASLSLHISVLIST
jgi:hypothetical protein